MEKYEILKFKDGEFELDVNVSPQEETVWLDEQQLSILFEVDRRTINYHINKILETKELEDSVCQKNWRTGTDGKNYLVRYYNLDMIISVGYRVNSIRGIQFRRWANQVLKQFLLNGFVVNQERCQGNPICAERFYELEKQINHLIQKQDNALILKEVDQIPAYHMIHEHLKAAKNEILIVDNYFTHKFDDILCHTPAKVTIITNIENREFESKSYKVIKTKKFHDRYVFVDDVCYHFGQSLNELGSKISTGVLLPNFTKKMLLNLLGLE